MHFMGEVWKLNRKSDSKDFVKWRPIGLFRQRIYFALSRASAAVLVQAKQLERTLVEGRNESLNIGDCCRKTLENFPRSKRVSRRFRMLTLSLELASSLSRRSDVGCCLTCTLAHGLPTFMEMHPNISAPLARACV